MPVKYTREILVEVVSRSRSYSDVRRNLGIQVASGGTHSHLKRRIQDLGINTEHFLGRAWARATPTMNKKSPSEILVVLTGHRRATSYMIRRALIESGVPHVCNECGLTPEWHGSPLVLEVDHIDGNWRNCVKGNLQFLCPNCHSQKSFTPRTCDECGAVVTKKSVLCNRCNPRRVSSQNFGKSHVEKGNWPTPAELALLIWKKPAVALAKEIGVSSSRLKQRCTAWGINTPPRGYWQKLRASV